MVIAWRGALYFVVLVNLLLVLAMVELLRLQRAKRLEPDAGVAFAGADVLPWSLFLQHGVFDDLALAALFVAAALRVLRKRAADNSMASLGATAFAVLYVGWMGSYLVRLRELPAAFARDPGEGFLFVLLAFLFTWVSDTAAYLFGTLFGRHRLAPRISPGKSLEGGIAALWCTGVAGGIAALTFMRPFFAPFVGVWLGVLASAVGQIGDLLASLLKRDAAVKDASTPAEIKNEVWEELKLSLNVECKIILQDNDLHDWFLDPDIRERRRMDVDLYEDAEPLMIAKVNTWHLRPDAWTAIPNLFLAADYLRTYTQLATMEAANEAARRAVNSIISASGANVPLCRLWQIHEPDILALWRWYDQLRYDRGQPWIFEMPWFIHAIQPVIAGILRLLHR